MRSAFLTVAAFILIPLWTVSSQGVQPKRGDRIRVTVPSLRVKPIVGIAERVPADTILVRTAAKVVSAFPLDRVARLEVSRGVRRPTWSKTAPLWMPLLGLSGGAIGGYSKPASRTSRIESGEFIGIVGGTVGLLIGTVIAIAVPGREKWEEVPTWSGSRTSLAPSLYADPAARRLRLGVRAGF